MTLWFKIVVACVPAAIVGICFDDILEKYLYNAVVVAAMLIIFGVGFIIVENNKIYALLENSRYFLKCRLYTLIESLPNNFVKINAPHNSFLKELYSPPLKRQDFDFSRSCLFSFDI